MVPAVILAAGYSTRMGRDKGLLPLPGGDCFFTRLARTFLSAGCPEVIVVAGSGADRVAATADRARLPARVVVNPDPSRGQLSSLQEALAVLPSPPPGGLLVTPVDLPLIAAATVRAIIDAWSRSGALVVRPAHGPRHGHPVLFDARLFAELRAADVSAGARAVVRAHSREVLDVDIDDRGAYDDVDTPEDYLRVFGVPLPTKT